MIKVIEAMCYKTLDDNKVICTLCPKMCVLKNKEIGFCHVRQNIDGKLFTYSFGNLVSIAIDPIEKKPLFHFYPGTKILSIATVGCNLDCLNCQNFDIAHNFYDKVKSAYIEPRELIDLAKRENIKFIAYTYNEPTIFYEYVLETSKIAKQENIKTAIISNGFINEKPLKQLIPFLDAANIDIKGFSDKTYEKLTTGKLYPVLNTVKLLKQNNVWVELTWLIVPKFTDDKNEFSKFIDWLYKLDSNIPLHISRFFPMYKLSHLYPTPIETMKSFYDIAKEKLNFVYLGNVYEPSNTYCPKCGSLLIERIGYKIVDHTDKGVCPRCEYNLPGRF